MIDRAAAAVPAAIEQSHAFGWFLAVIAIFALAATLLTQRLGNRH